MTVKKNDRGWDFRCDDCGFASTQHPTRKAATERGGEHTTEHEGNT